jgi:hypothetical protein
MLELGKRVHGVERMKDEGEGMKWKIKREEGGIRN